jgi:hypothetical protein
MPLTAEGLEAVLAADDWPFERAADATWFSAFRPSAGPGQTITFFLRLTDDWLFLTISPFAVLPDDPATETALMRRLLELNRTINLAKFAIERRDIVLTVELPTEDITASQIRDGLDALSFFALKHHAEITAVASPAS